MIVVNKLLHNFFEFKERKLNENGVFNSTIYRVPTTEELSKFLETDLDPEDIYNEIGYTIIGRGIKSPKNMGMIMETCHKMVKEFPNEHRFKKVLEIAQIKNQKF